MIKKSVVMFLASLLSLTHAYADGTLFNGLNVTLRSDTHNTSTDFSGNGQSVNTTMTSSAASVQVENTLAFDSLHVGLGVSMQVTPLSQGNGAPLNIVSENRLSLYIAPGVVVGESTLLYGIVTSSNIWNKAGLNNSGATYKLTGIGLGAGVKVPVWKKSFVMAEVTQNQFQSVKVDGVDIKGASTEISIGIGCYF